MRQEVLCACEDHPGPRFSSLLHASQEAAKLALDSLSLSLHQNQTKTNPNQ